MANPEYKINKDTSIKILIILKDEDGNIVPVTTSDRHSVQIKAPYANIVSYPYTVGITGPVISYGSQSGSTYFYFTLTANHLGDWKYKVQYDAFASGSYELIGPYIKAATVGSFRVVDDDF
jgi:hypothetical protein